MDITFAQGKQLVKRRFGETAQLVRAQVPGSGRYCWAVTVRRDTPGLESGPGGIVALGAGPTMKDAIAAATRAIAQEATAQRAVDTMESRRINRAAIAVGLGLLGAAVASLLLRFLFL